MATVNENWGMINQCYVDTTGTPFYIKFCRARYDNFWAFFVSPDPGSFPNSYNDYLDDKFNPVLPGDKMLLTTDFEPICGAAVKVDLNPIVATRESLLAVQIGNLIFMATRPWPPSLDPLHRDEGGLWKIIPKDVVIRAELCFAGGVPCIPQIGFFPNGNMQTYLPIGGGNFFQTFPITNNRNNNKILIHLGLLWPACCYQDAVISIIYDEFGSLTLESPPGGVIPNGTIAQDLIINYDATLLLSPGLISYNFTLLLETPGCGSVDIPGVFEIDVPCTPAIEFNANGGSYQIPFVTFGDSIVPIAHNVPVIGVVSPTSPPVKSRDPGVSAPASFDLTWTQCCDDDATLTINDPNGFAALAGGPSEIIPNATANYTANLVLDFSVFPIGNNSVATFYLTISTPNCGVIDIPYTIPYLPCPCSFTAVENNTIWHRAATPGIPFALPLLVNTVGSTYTPDIAVDFTYSQCMQEDLTATIIATGGRVLHFIAGPPINIPNGTLSQVLSGFIFDLQAVDPTDLIAGNIAFTLRLNSTNCGQVLIPFLIPITP